MVATSGGGFHEAWLLLYEKLAERWQNGAEGRDGRDVLDACAARALVSGRVYDASAHAVCADHGSRQVMLARGSRHWGRAAGLVAAIRGDGRVHVFIWRGAR
jgi:hypothetical protein